MMRRMFLRVLFIGTTADADSIAEILSRSEIELDREVVTTPEAVKRALADDSWSAVVANDVVDGWSGLDALRLVREHDVDVPFILLSGKAGEDAAVEAMRAGATDYVVKDGLGRLAPALEREVRDAATRRERTHLFAELRRNKERFRVTFDKAPIGIATISPGAQFATVNDRFARIVGYTRRELIGRRFSDIIHPDDIADAEARHAAYHEGVRAKMELEHRMLHKDGRTVWVSVTLTPVFGAAQEFEQVIALVHDVTPYRLATERVELQARLLDSVEQAVIATDVEGRITYWNRYAEGLYGWRLGEVRGRYVLDVTAAPFRRPAAEQTMERLREGESWSGESLMLRRDGTTFPAWVVAAPILGLAGKFTGIVAVSHDITRLKRAEQQSRRYGVQQAAAANLGSLALSGAPLDTLFREAAAFVREVLLVDFCEIVKTDGGQRLVIVAGTGWEEGVVGAERAGGPRSVAEVTVRERAPLVTRDITTDPRLAPVGLLRRHRVRGAAAIPIGAAGEPWGFIGAYTREERLLTDSDVDFLRTVATVLGQSIERVRADVEVRIRAAQQSAIAELGMVAFSTVDQHTLDRACELAQNALGVEYALLHERKEGRLVVCAAPSWPEHIGNVTPIGAGTQSGMTASTRVPVVVTDYRTDRRFLDPARTLAASHGVRSGMSVPIAGARSFFGVLSIYSGEPRNFTEADVHFLQSLANTLTEAMEREEATRALITSELRYRSVIEGASEIIFDIDPVGIICALNRAFETITGHSRDAFIGRHFSELFDAKDGERASRLFTHILRRPRTAQWEAATTRADGSRVLLDISFAPKIADGGVVALHGFARDITEARRVERERQHLTANLQLLLESTADGLIAVDVRGRCQLINRAAERMLRRSFAEVTGRNLHVITHDGTTHSADHCQMFDPLTTGMTVIVPDDTFHRADGSSFPVEYSAAPMMQDGRTVGVVVTFTDITERRRLEQKLEQANRLSSLGRLAATIAHEFNNVLMGIAPFAEVIRRTTDRDRIEASLGQIGHSVARGKRITSEILRFTQPADPVRARVGVNEWLHAVKIEALSILSPMCALDVDAEDDLAIEGDVSQLHQVLMNLILNARDAMPGGGSITVRAAKSGAFVHLSVRDTGMGMSAETQRHIFEPLFTTKKTGTGLGLPLAHQIVARHDGEISVESAPGAGTTFHIFLPASYREAELPPEPVPAPPPTALRRVVLVEDDAAVAAGIVSILEMEGLEVEIIDNGTEAIALLREDPPDVVVLDIDLPDMAGTTVYEAVSKTHPALPVIFSTGHADSSWLDVYLARPHVAYLLKPYDATALLKAIEEVA